MDTYTWVGKRPTNQNKKFHFIHSPRLWTQGVVNRNASQNGTRCMKRESLTRTPFGLRENGTIASEFRLRTVNQGLARTMPIIEAVYVARHRRPLHHGANNSRIMQRPMMDFELNYSSTGREMIQKKKLRCRILLFFRSNFLDRSIATWPGSFHHGGDRVVN